MTVCVHLKVRGPGSGHLMLCVTKGAPTHSMYQQRGELAVAHKPVGRADASA
jgi:hypothetical protein